ncbi:MAG: ornithine carbamoyltransferase [Planctomycetota bacterium]|nr:ornithine carbamoyltransferase [Planctomycetota bacterium]
MKTNTSMRGRDFLSVTDCTPAEVRDLLDLAVAIKADPAAYRRSLDAKSIVVIFEKPSLRTRLSFDVGINRLGGHSVVLDHTQQRLGERETVSDYGKNIERWCDAIIARVFKQTVIQELADASRVPVVNALSDRFHPCQALADLMTLREHAERSGRTLADTTLAYIGDGNNVCHSLVHAAAMLGVRTTIITPKGREAARDVIADAVRLAGDASMVRESTDPADVRGADAVYTDVWVSMGQGEETHQTFKTFGRYQVNAELMGRAGRDGRKAWFMHCLPAHRGKEVTDEVIDSSQSIVYDQAENRMHAQNALLVRLLS